MLEHELAIATDLARAAAAAILAVKSSARLTSSAKADSSPVTAADLAADSVIRAGLAAAFADDVVVTEESWGGQALPETGRVWIVDPLDGTRDFVAGSADYVVQIALVIDGHPRLGVVCQPEGGRVWRGVVVDGASLCEHIDSDGAVSARPVARAQRPRPRLTISVSHPSAVVDALCSALDAVVVPRGSVGLKIGAILDDEADGYITDSQHIKVWDTAAPAAILLAAGGTFTSLSSLPLRYDAGIAHDDGVAAFAVDGDRFREALTRSLAKR